MGKNISRNNAPVPNWLPCWKDTNSYPSTDCDDMVRWFWEFLRRNHGYQQGFLEYSQSEGLEKERIMLSLQHFFGVRNLVAPREPFSSQVAEQLSHGLSYASGLECPGTMEQVKDLIARIRPFEHYSFTIKYRVDVSIEKQINQARKLLETAQDEYYGGDVNKIEDKRPQLSVLHKYLRVLDAKAHGAKNKEIASVLKLCNIEEPNEHIKKTVQNQMKAAERIRDDDIRHLRFQGR